MSLCPTCKTPGAYVGFTSVECRNPDCQHFKDTLFDPQPSQTVALSNGLPSGFYPAVVVPQGAQQPGKTVHPLRAIYRALSHYIYKTRANAPARHTLVNYYVRRVGSDDFIPCLSDGTPSKMGPSSTVNVNNYLTYVDGVTDENELPQ
jgi:hypothetical protein